MNADDEPRLGVPSHRGEHGGSSAADRPTADDLDARPGETGLGRPVERAVSVTPLSQSDRKAVVQAAEREAAAQLAEAEELLAAQSAVVPLPPWLAHPVLAAALLAMAGLTGLFVVSQTAATLNALSALPQPWQAVGLVAVAVFGGAALLAALRLAVLYLRLRRNRQVTLRGLEELSKRTHLRWVARTKSAAAKAQLEDYLRGHPAGTDAGRKALKPLGFAPDAFAEMDKAARDLLDPNRFTTTQDWFERFRAGYQSHLDAAADARVAYWAKRTAVVTALSPNPLVDTLATVYFGFAMASDLCRVYHLRAGRAGTTVLLARVFFNAYLAGQVNELEGVSEQAIEHLVSPAGALSELAAARVLAKVGTKTAAGVLNYFLLLRLGRFTARLLRPVGAE